MGSRHAQRLMLKLRATIIITCTPAPLETVFGENYYSHSYTNTDCDRDTRGYTDSFTKRIPNS